MNMCGDYHWGMVRLTFKVSFTPGDWIRSVARKGRAAKELWCTKLEAQETCPSCAGRTTGTGRCNDHSCPCCLGTHSGRWGWGILGVVLPVLNCRSAQSDRTATLRGKDLRKEEHMEMEALNKKPKSQASPSGHQASTAKNACSSAAFPKRTPQASSSIFKPT